VAVVVAALTVPVPPTSAGTWEASMYLSSSFDLQKITIPAAANAIEKEKKRKENKTWASENN
jgi:hypothetical protein